MPMNTMHFGAEVNRRRNELGLTQQEVAAANGPSDTTQRKIEAGSEINVSVLTLRKYDEALRWPEGTAAALLAAGQGGASDVASAAPVAGQRKHHGAWELDHRILAELSLKGDNVEIFASSAMATDEEDEVEDVVATAHLLADEAIKFVAAVNEILEVGVGGRAHLRLLRSKIQGESRDKFDRGRLGRAMRDKAAAAIAADQGSQPDYDLARRTGETESEWRERTGNDFE